MGELFFLSTYLMKSSELLCNSRFALIFEVFLGLEEGV